MTFAENVGTHAKCRIDDELALMNLDSGQFQALTDSASTIWQPIASATSSSRRAALSRVGHIF